MMAPHARRRVTQRLAVSTINPSKMQRHLDGVANIWLIIVLKVLALIHGLIAAMEVVTIQSLLALLVMKLHNR